MRRHFPDHERGILIAHTPAPLPCPFCGQDGGCIEFRDDKERGQYAVATCGVCGVELVPIYYSSLEDLDSEPVAANEERKYSLTDLAVCAANLWNERKPPRAVTAHELIEDPGEGATVN